MNKDDCCNDNRINDREMGAQQMRQPMGPPPGFTPTLPEEDIEEQRGMFGGQPGFGPGRRPNQRGDNSDRRRRQGNIRRCLQRFTFIWLVNGNSFWFFPIIISGQQIIGFRWRRGVWVYDRINIRRILYHQCY